MKRYFVILTFLVNGFSYAQKDNRDSENLLGRKVSVYTTADSTELRLSPSGTITFSRLPQPLESQICIFVDPSRSFQQFIGIGGALTDAVAETFAKLPTDKQAQLLSAYFDKQSGIAYTIARTNINSCDFSSDTYTYVRDGDSSLQSFNIEHDKKYKIPLIKKAFAAAGGNLQLFASPWSPPAFMKDNNDMLHGGRLLPKYYHAWASYYTRFIQAYQKEGIPVWGITIQNEPMARQIWESCIYTAQEEKDFLKYHLGPVMKNAGLSGTKIIVWDHNRDMVYQRSEVYMSDPGAAKYIWGIGFHWYEPWSGGQPMFENIKRVHESFPDKHLFFTEGCAESFNPAKYYDWSLGEKYANNMLNDFNNGTVGFTDWNILLDETGGPNHVGNFCFAPVHANIQTGELIFTNAYYYIGHFSKFIQPGAKRISCTPSRSQLQATAFKNPDGKITVVVLNLSSGRASYSLWVKGYAAPIEILPHSIQTLIF